jgi:hypothetical protein
MLQKAGVPPQQRHLFVVDVVVNHYCIITQMKLNYT